jgi:DNA replication and repair protein RecF
MEIRGIEVRHFRNLNRVGRVTLPGQGVVVLVAKNASGKTNFLEAIMLLLRGKSWRARTEECVEWGENYFVVQGEVMAQGERANIKVAYDKERRALRLTNEEEPISVVVMYGRYPVVLFLPEDTFLLQRGPAARRNFLNNVLVSSPKYLPALVQYYRVLKQRNAALKTAKNWSEVAAWTQLLQEYGEVLTQQRKALLEFTEAQLPDLYQQLTGERRDWKIRLAKEEIIKGEEQFAEEKRVGYTLGGAHRQDMVVWVTGRPAKSVLSQGQTRSLVIALKLISCRWLENMTGEKPVVLLDEVLGELDRERQQLLLTHLPDNQVIMTCTELPEVLVGREGVTVVEVGLV